MTIKLDQGTIKVLLQYDQVNVQTQETVGGVTAQSSSITVVKDSWVYVGVSWRNNDGRVALMVEDEMDAVYGVFLTQTVYVSIVS